MPHVRGHIIKKGILRRTTQGEFHQYFMHVHEFEERGAMETYMKNSNGYPQKTKKEIKEEKREGTRSIIFFVQSYKTEKIGILDSICDRNLRSAGIDHEIMIPVEFDTLTFDFLPDQDINFNGAEWNIFKQISEHNH